MVLVDYCNGNGTSSLIHGVKIFILWYSDLHHHIDRPAWVAMFPMTRIIASAAAVSVDLLVSYRLPVLLTLHFD